MTAKEQQQMKDIELPLFIRKDQGKKEMSEQSAESTKPTERPQTRVQNVRGFSAIFTLARLALILAPMTMKA
jgi:hypothetical protein